jgi:hypothetical protein
VFSGAASSCCAPVLAGVLTLSAVSSSLPQALMIGSAYILGMVAPLMVLAYFWDRLQLANHAIVRGRHLTLRAGPIEHELHSTNLIAGVMFLAMGALIIVLAFMGEATGASDAQVRFSAELTRIADGIVSTVDGAPDFAFALVLFGGTIVLFIKAFPAIGRPIGRIAGGVRLITTSALRPVRPRRPSSVPRTLPGSGAEPAAAPTALEEVHHG